MLAIYSSIIYYSYNPSSVGDATVPQYPTFDYVMLCDTQSITGVSVTTMPISESSTECPASFISLSSLPTLCNMLYVSEAAETRVRQSACVSKFFGMTLEALNSLTDPEISGDYDSGISQITLTMRKARKTYGSLAFVVVTHLDTPLNRGFSSLETSGSIMEISNDNSTGMSPPSLSLSIHTHLLFPPFPLFFCTK